MLHHRRPAVFSKLLGCMVNPDVQLPTNSTGTQVDTVAGTATKARQVAAIGDAVTPAQLLAITARFAAMIEGPAAAGAAIAGAGNPQLLGGSDGTLLRALNVGGAAILAALSSSGALLATRPGDWSVNHTPGAAAQATASRAAGAAGVRHVCTSISSTLVTVGTAQTVITINLRDGATGAGTILWSKSIILPVNSVWEVNISGLNIVGSAATAMTLEFSAAGVAASLESVALTGYDTPAA
jgi:hypothetical protein